jgi:hypothetical protein
MVKINFDKYDAGCRDNVWTWYIPNKNNTKDIKVIVEFPPVPIADSINEGQLKVKNIYFEEKENKDEEQKVFLTFRHTTGDTQNYVHMLVNKEDSKREDQELIKKAFWDKAEFDDSLWDYWISDTDIASVENKTDITEEEIKVLRKFGIIYACCTDFNKEEK